MNDLPAERPKPELPAELIQVSPRSIYETFLRRRSRNTIDAYRRDLRAFGEFVDMAPRDAVAGLLGLDLARANALARNWLLDMQEKGYAPSTINRRLSTLRSMVQLARQHGMVTWEVEVQNVRSQKYRDTSGPGNENVVKMLELADRKVLEGDPKKVTKHARDAAIVHMLYGLALRRFEVANLDMEDVDLERRRLRIVAKGQAEPTFMTMSSTISRAIARYLQYRGNAPGVLFVSCDPTGKGTGRLAGSSIRRVVKKLGQELGIKVWPHALRHAGVTDVLDATDGDVRMAQRFSRHKKLDTLLLYDDNREDKAGQAADLLARKLEEKLKERRSEEDDDA